MNKICTDLEQSKVLAEILPLKSADMRIGNYVGKYGCVDGTNVHYYYKNESFGAPEIIPCWSLAALLDYLKQKYYVRLDHDGVSWSITCIEHDTGKKYTSSMFDEQVDACYEMIVTLKEKGLL